MIVPLPPAVKDSVPDAPRLIAAPTTKLPAAEISNEVGAPEMELVVSVVAPWEILTNPVRFTFKVATLVLTVAEPLPPVKDREPDDTKEPAPEMEPVVAVVREILPLAVTVPLTTMSLAALVVTDKAPEPNDMVLSWREPV